MATTNTEEKPITSFPPLKNPLKHNEPPTPFDDKITAAFGLREQLSSMHYQILEVQIEKHKRESLGIQLTERCIVHGVNRDHADVMFGDLWLELNGVPLEDKRCFHKTYRAMLKASGEVFKLKLMVARLVCRFPMDLNRLPPDILPRRDFCYHIAALYGLPGLHLTLGLRAVNGKVFVSTIQEETLSKMAFSVGDAILDVNASVVTNIADAYSWIRQILDSYCIVTFVVERAGSEHANILVLDVLRSEKNLVREEKFNRDVEKICRRERRKLQREPDVRAEKSILRSRPSTTSDKPRRIRISTTPTVVDIQADIAPTLLQSVPSRHVLPLDTMLAPGQSAEQILAEQGSDVESRTPRTSEPLSSNSVRRKAKRRTAEASETVRTDHADGSHSTTGTESRRKTTKTASTTTKSCRQTKTQTQTQTREG